MPISYPTIEEAYDVYVYEILEYKYWIKFIQHILFDDKYISIFFKTKYLR